VVRDSLRDAGKSLLGFYKYYNGIFWGRTKGKEMKGSWQGRDMEKQKDKGIK